MTFVTEDSIDIPNASLLVHIIRRPDPYAPMQPETELPKAGEVVEINGVKRTVLRAMYSGDSEFKWWPHFHIETPINEKL